MNNTRNKKYDIGIVDYKTCNLHSVELACHKSQLKFIKSSNAKILENCSALILPGVGSFKEAMSNIKKYDLDKLINNFENENRPIFGICLGMQLLFSNSSEFGMCEGLDIIKGSVKKFNYNEVDIIPHTGWNKISIKFDDKYFIKKKFDNQFVYFVHSFYVEPNDTNFIFSTSVYKKKFFCSSVKKNNIYGFQFHPEKSGKVGLDFYYSIKNFLKQKNYENSI